MHYFLSTLPFGGVGEFLGLLKCCDLVLVPQHCSGWLVPGTLRLSHVKGLCIAGLNNNYKFYKSLKREET